MTARPVRRLDPLAAPLAGLNLIEANAGTGKTWTIAALYLRLLLETRRSVGSILVVTFTEAATAELRDRIRARVAAARDLFAKGESIEDPVAMALLDKTDRREGLLRLTAAIREFDQAPIYTIHGFCQRVLTDRAFEVGGPFRSEILVDTTALLQEIVQDFWRSELAQSSPLFARFLADRKGATDPESLRKEIASHVAKPYVELRGPAPIAHVEALEHSFNWAFEQARTIWSRERADIEARLSGAVGLNRRLYPATSRAGWFDQMDACLSGAAAVDLCGCFVKFTTSTLIGATNAGGTTPKHAFFDACERVTEAKAALERVYQAKLRTIKARLIEFCDRELVKRKAQREVQSYDDLLLNVHRALEGEEGAAFAQVLRNQYSAALLDEFQDTDPLQYGIFSRIYRGSQLPVFMVGDPKQSIYSFRGADVFTYLAARADAAHEHTLDLNWRSVPPLLEAVNALFGRSAAPFMIKEITFRPSAPAEGDRGSLDIEGEGAAPLELWYLESDGAPIAKGNATDLAVNATAAKIARLLSMSADKTACIRDPGAEMKRKLRGGDIAVLVRTHRQARTVRQALSTRGVASVIRGAENVFVSAEAEELERVLLAIAEPGRESLIAGALVTELLGFSGNALAELKSDEAEWERTVGRFREAHREWREHGFIRMLRRLIRTEGIVCRLLAYSDGERRVTNLLHLAELLHCEAATLGASGLVAWLATKRRQPNPAIEAELLRLESDENLVKILTIHVAKGLEFPLVFCPCLWDVKLWAEKDPLVRFHDPDEGYRPVLDVGSDALEVAREHARREELAENVRLLYVALTRARHRLSMVWGHVKEAECSALAWLLHGPSDRKSAAAFESFFGGAVSLAPASMRADLELIEKASRGNIRVCALPHADARFDAAASNDAPLTDAREFTRQVRDTARVTSFTALAHGRSLEAPDYDASDEEPTMDSSRGTDIFSFPRGAQAGKCVHAIFEEVDFVSRPRAALDRTVEAQLKAHGLDSAWKALVADVVDAVVETPLDGSGMRLADVPRTQRLDELEFYYPISELSDAGLRDLLLEHDFPAEIRNRIENLSFVRTQGYMRGFIDLVFEHRGRYYLADYKSNWLGPTPAAYKAPNLARAMAQEAYYLQYLVYCIALHRYLAKRIRDYRYETHFGGVRYLFIRGMSPRGGHTTGVFADRPSEDLVRALDAYLDRDRSGTHG